MDDTQIQDVIDQNTEENAYGVSLVPYHTHNGTDSPQVLASSLALDNNAINDVNNTRHGLAPVSPADATKFLNGAATPVYAQVKDSDQAFTDITTNNASTSKHGFLKKLSNVVTQFLDGTGNFSVPVVNSINVSFWAGETLLMGDVVRIYLAGGDYASKGYNQTNNTLYVARASADTTTYGNFVLGACTANTAYLGTATIAIAGDAGGFSGLSGSGVPIKYYLDNHSAASSQTITQTVNNSNQAMTGVTVNQLITPTESLLEKITLSYNAQSGPAGTLSVDLRRASTILGTASANFTNNAQTDCQVTFSPAIQTYKGETLNLNITATRGLLYYQASTAPYNGSATGGSIPASSDIYFKIFEFTNFGKLNSTAGTRKVKMGIALSATDLALQIQEADANL